jgi:hypothetical protein
VVRDLADETKRSAYDLVDEAGILSMLLLSPEQTRRRREAFLAKRAVGEYQGIVLCNLRNHARNVDLFIKRTTDALDLVEFFDPRRFHRIKKHIHYVADGYSISAGAYDRFMRVCTVDLNFLKFQEAFDWYRFQYAGLIVHEATHGAIEARGIPYYRRHRIRIERLCVEEERRFLRRACPWRSYADVKLDEDWYRQYYGFWSHLRLVCRRVKEIVEDEKPKL